jgi:hypothetical protein
VDSIPLRGIRRREGRKRSEISKGARKKEFSHLLLLFNIEDSCSMDIYLTG